MNPIEVEWMMTTTVGDPELPELRDFLRRPPCMARAARRTAQTATYFPGNGQSAQTAKETCLSCPVRRECLEYALADPEVVGVWGGTTEGERWAMRRPTTVAS